MFTESPEKIIYAYGAWQNKFSEVQKSISNIEFFEGLPTKQDLDTWAVNGQHRVLVLDDLMSVAEHDKSTFFSLYKIYFLVVNISEVYRYRHIISSYLRIGEMNCKYTHLQDNCFHQTFNIL